MYHRKEFEVDDRNLIIEVMKDYAFATVITGEADRLNANHYPFLVDADEKSIRLFTHLARSNNQYTELENQGRCLVIFQGPHAYISPAYYKNPLNVPTWSYVAVHAYCEVKLIEEPLEIAGLLNRTVLHFEGKNQTRWLYDLPEDFKQRLTSAIVGLRMDVVKIESKFKLSQNRKKEDYLSTMEALANSGDPIHQELLHFMRKTSPKF